MKITDYRSLRVLDEIGKNSEINQRNLAEKLNISLGLANSFLKSLAEKGYFTIKSLPKKRRKYILTPEGAAEKTRLTYHYIKHSFEVYKTNFGMIDKTIAALSKKGVSTIAFYGVTVITEMAHVSIANSDVRLSAVIDDSKKGNVFSGQVVQGLEDISAMAFDKIIVTAFNPYDGPIRKLLDHGVMKEQIVTFDMEL